jgi:hypothetical protein
MFSTSGRARLAFQITGADEGLDITGPAKFAETSPQTSRRLKINA